MFKLFSVSMYVGNKKDKEKRKYVLAPLFNSLIWWSLGQKNGFCRVSLRCVCSLPSKLGLTSLFR